MSPPPCKAATDPTAGNILIDPKVLVIDGSRSRPTHGAPMGEGGEITIIADNILVPGGDFQALIDRGDISATGAPPGSTARSSSTRPRSICPAGWWCWKAPCSTPHRSCASAVGRGATSARAASPGSAAAGCRRARTGRSPARIRARYGGPGRRRRGAAGGRKGLRRGAARRTERFGRRSQASRHAMARCERASRAIGRAAGMIAPARLRAVAGAVLLAGARAGRRRAGAVRAARPARRARA